MNKSLVCAVLSAIVLLGTTLAGCGGTIPGTTIAPSPFAGEFIGQYVTTGRMGIASMHMTVAQDGTITGKTFDIGENAVRADLPVSGTVSNSGKLILDFSKSHIVADMVLDNSGRGCGTLIAHTTNLVDTAVSDNGKDEVFEFWKQDCE